MRSCAPPCLLARHLTHPPSSLRSPRYVGGSITVKWAVYNSVYDDTDFVQKDVAGAAEGESAREPRTVPRLALKIEVVSAKGLGQADKFGLSDPFVKIKFDGQEVAKTKVLNDTLDPVWTDERFVLTLPAEDIKTGAGSNRSGS